MATTRYIINVEFEFDVEEGGDPGDIIHAMLRRTVYDKHWAGYHLDIGSLRKEGEPRK